MNLNLRPLLVLVLTTLVVISCKNDENEDPRGKISARINDVLFETSGSAVVYSNSITIGGDMGDKRLSIFVSKAAQPGTYDAMAPTAGNIAADAEVNYSPDNEKLYSSIHTFNGQKAGTVIITEIDEAAKTISGTFTCRVIDDDHMHEDITGGTFNSIPYITDPLNSLTAVVDGQPFTATSFKGTKPITEIILKTAAANSSSAINLYFDYMIRPGTYSLGEPGALAWAAYDVNNIFFISDNGTVTISKHDLSLRRIEGSFSFDAVLLNQASNDQPKITDGMFALTY